MTDTTSTNPPASTPAATPAYDPTKNYDVTLSRVIEWPVGSGFYHSPRDHHIMSGAMCSEIASAITAAKPV